MTDLTLSPISIGGLDLVALEADTGVLWAAEKLDGWGSPAVTLDVKQRPRAHGGIGGESFLKPRNISVSGYVDAPSEAALSDAIDRLCDAVSLVATTFSVSEGGRLRTAQVRRTDEVIYDKLSPTSAEWSFQVIAEDPRKYGAEIVASTYLPSTTGGLTLPLTLPFSINATTTTGQIALYNPGNISSPARLRIDGPCYGPIITHAGQGRQLVLSSSYTVAAGSWLDIDLANRRILENGQASRNAFLISRGWFDFDPGDNVIGFGAATYDPASRLWAYVSPAYQ